MDTLFRLVSFQPDQQSFNSSRTSSSSRSSKQGAHHFYPNQYTTEEDEECCNLNAPQPNTSDNVYMDEDDFSSSSSSKHFYNPFAPTPTTSYTTPPTSKPHYQTLEPSEFSYPHGFSLDFTASPNWASEILLQCARALSSRDTARVQQLMWMLNELASPYGDPNQKIAAYFLQALLARVTSSGARTLTAMAAAYERNCSFDSTRKTALRFQEVSPWATFGHVASNGAILEAFDGEPRVHILDLSNTFCTQWPTLLEALATRSDETPHLRLTTVLATPSCGADSALQRVMNEIGSRMEKFARLMGVPFKFQAIHHAGDISALDFRSLIAPDEILAINCVNALHGVRSGSLRDSLLASLRRLQPKIVTIVEEEADIRADGGDYVRTFEETLRFFSTYFDALDESFARPSNERLSLERAAGRAIVDLVACEPGESAERRETAATWSERAHRAGLSPMSLSDDAADDVKALLRRYREGWSMAYAREMDASAAGIFLCWKEQPVVWASAWKP